MLKKKKGIAIFMIAALVLVFLPQKQVEAEKTTFSLTWNGSSSPSSSAAVSKDNYNSSKDLYAAFTMRGEAFIGTANMSGVPTNYTLKTGKPSNKYPVNYSNLGTYLMLDLTPAAKYNGQTVKCTVSLLGVSGCNLTSNGNYDYR